MKTTKHFYVVAILMFFFPVVSFGGNKSLVYTGHITQPDGSAINAGNVTFTFTVYAPNGAHGSDCVLYEETQVVDMTSKQGTFSVRIGEGTRVSGYLQADLERLFQNTGTFSGLACSSGSGNFQPTPDEHRELGVSFLHGATTVNLDRKVISSVPFASAVTGTANVNSLAIRNSSNSQVALAAPSGAFTNFALTLPSALPGATSLMKVSATGVISFETLPTCAGTEFLQADGTNLTCVTPTAGSGTVTSITAGAGLTGGTITGSGTIGLGTELSGLSGLGSNGFVQRTGAGTYSVSSAIDLTSQVTGALPIANGGTGQTTASGAINALVPTQTTHNGEFLTTDGTTVSWAAVPSAGITALTGDVTASGSGSVAATIANSAVTYAKIQNVGANSLVGNPTGGATAATNVTLGSGLEFNTGALRTINSSTASGGNNTLVMRNGSGVTEAYGVGVAGSTSGLVTLIAPTTFTSYNLTLPSDDGTSGQVLQTDGSGVLSWVSASASSGIRIEDTSTLYVGSTSGPSSHTSGALQNLAVGVTALDSINNTSADGNSALGYAALTAVTTGSQNTAVGASSLGAAVSGDSNVAVGFQAGLTANAGSSGNIFLGTNSGPSSAGAVSNSLYIDNSATDTPLIGGDFSANTVTVNGAFNATGLIGVGGAGVACSTNGTLRFDSGNLQVCNSSTWSTLGTGSGTVTSVSGTTNQITVTGTTSVTLSTPQDIHSGASPTFVGVTLSGLSTGGFVKNNASGVLSTAATVNLATEVTGTLPVANGGTGATTFSSNQVLIGNGSSAISSSATLPNAVMDNITRLGTVTTGTWNATAIGATYGGTGQTAVTTGDILYGSASNTWSRLPAGTNGHVLTLAGGIPSWSAPSGGGDMDVDTATPFETSVGFEAGDAVTAGGLSNSFFGYQAGNAITTGDENTALGRASGATATGDSSRNIFLGYSAGPGSSSTVNDKLYVDVSATDTPLIYGDFSSNQVKINGSLATGVGTNSTALTSTITPNFTAANFVRSTATSSVCSGTVDFRTDSGIVAGGSYTFTIAEATTLCEISFNGSTTNLKITADYVPGTTVDGVVYTAIYDGAVLWVSYVPF